MSDAERLNAVLEMAREAITARDARIAELEMALAHKPDVSTSDIAAVHHAMADICGVALDAPSLPGV